MAGQGGPVGDGPEIFDEDQEFSSGKTVVRIAAVLLFVSAFGTGFAHEVWTVVIFRIVGGIGVGLASVSAPAYIAETSPPAIREPNEPLWLGLDA